MTDRRLPSAAGQLARALRTAAGCWWQLIRFVLRRGSTPHEGNCDKGITHCAHRATPRKALQFRLNVERHCGARQEIADCRSDLVTVRLEREVAGVEEAHICVRH